MKYKFTKRITNLESFPFIGVIKYENGKFKIIAEDLRIIASNRKIYNDHYKEDLHVYAECEFNDGDYIIRTNGDMSSYCIIENDKMIPIGAKFDMLMHYIEKTDKLNKKLNKNLLDQSEPKT